MSAKTKVILERFLGYSLGVDAFLLRFCHLRLQLAKGKISVSIKLIGLTLRFFGRRSR